MPLPFVASFAGDRPAGSVVGRRGITGIDTERIIGIDQGALRIAPLVHPGWGRSAVCWGPHTPRCGLSAAVLVLNGHHGSENADPWPSLPRYLTQWARGTQVDPVLARLVAYRRYGGRMPLRRRLAARRANRQAVAAGHTQEENLAVGLFGSPAPIDPDAGGAAFVVRSTGPTNATLTAGPRRTPVLTELQNVPLLLVVVLREQGALYCVGSLDGVRGTAAIPSVRPVLIDPSPVPEALWAGVHQAVLGQVGWAVDTRVDAVRLACPPQWRSWSTSALVAARRPLPAGTGGTEAAAMPAAPPEPAWRTVRLDAARTVLAATAPAPIGLVHARVRLLTAEARVGLAVRVDADAASGWLVSASGSGVAAEFCVDGRVVHRHIGPRGLPLVRPASLQVVDDGRTIEVVIDGEPVLGPFPAGDADPTGFGVRDLGHTGDAELVDVEAHPRLLALPAELRPPVPECPAGDAVVYEDRFDGVADSLAGRRCGTASWSHTVGATPFVLDGDGALVRPVQGAAGGIRDKAAALVRSEEHRNLFTLPWSDPALADLSVTLVAPGSARGQGQRGRGGLVFRQDHDHQLIVNTWIDDEYDGTSVSSFLRIGGFEDVYDAVWTNVGRRITWGRPYELRAAFDGNTYVVFVDGEPVLYRRITDIVPGASRLRIEQVGIVSNWEFGDDTGTRFLRFAAARRTAPPQPAPAHDVEAAR